MDTRIALRATLVAAILLLGGAGTVAASGATLQDLDGEGTEAEPYVITDAEDLQAMQQDKSAHYVLESDVDASETETWNGGQGFEPVGTEASPFTGTLDGQGHTVDGLTVDRSETGVGLFGGLGAEGAVRNLHVENADVRGTKNVGIVAGRADGTVESVTVTGELHVAGGDVGGAIGTGSATVEDAHADVTIETEAEGVGALAGSLRTGGEVRASSARGTVEGEYYVGGLVGALTEDTSVLNSYASADATGSEASIGGLVGTNRGGVVKNVYATGDVSGDLNVGGLVGRHLLGGEVSQGVATGAVDGNRVTGAAVGEQSAAVRNLYWVEQSGVPSSGVGDGNGDGVTGLSESELTGADAETNADALDFANFWQATDESPVLQWQVETVDLELASAAVGEGESMDATVTLTLDDGSTVTASEVADYDSETAVAAVDAGTLQAENQGVTEVTASVAGQSDTVEVEVLEPPSIELVDAELRTGAVTNGTPAAVEATFENTGGPGTQTAVVTLDGETVVEESVVVEADGETTTELQWTPESGGAVALNDTDLGELTVVESGTVSVADVQVPEEVGAGGTYHVDVTFANEADQAVAEEVELRVGGEVVSSKFVIAGAGESIVSFPNSVDEQGPATHVVAVGDQEETATTEIVEPVALAVRDVEVPDSATPGSTVDVSATVENEGGPGAREVTLLLDGEPIRNESVDVDPGDSATVRAALDVPENETEHDVTFDTGHDSAAATLQVQSDDGLPGFGIGVALVALLAVSLFARRRR